MSDSSLSSAGPAKATLEQALRHAVQRVYKNGNLEELTVKRLRTAAEQDLDLEDGFYKNDPKWKEESKNIIQAEVVRITLQLYSYISCLTQIEPLGSTQCQVRRGAFHFASFAEARTIFKTVQIA